VFWFGDGDWNVKVCSGVGECELVSSKCVFVCEGVNYAVKVCSGVSGCELLWGCTLVCVGVI
jgi:hypothetical protein